MKISTPALRTENLSRKFGELVAVDANTVAIKWAVPLGVIDEVGADALRFALTAGVTSGAESTAGGRHGPRGSADAGL